jgi:outer membrane protein TolC
MPALLPVELISRRPDLAAQEQRLVAAGFDVRRARASLYPRLSLTGSTGRLSSDVEDLLDSDFSVWSLAANLLQPVFQGGRLRAGVDLAEARQRELASTWAQAVLGAFAEVELSLAAADSLAVQADALRRAAEQAVEAQELAERRYDAGLADFLSVLQSQRDASLSQTALLAVRRQQLEARVDLHLALGGGFGTAQNPSS